MKLTKTERGFSNGKFKDSYGNKCSIQKSSRAFEDYIWLGIDKPKCIVFDKDNQGKYVEIDIPNNWMMDSRMHLLREDVKELIPLLEKFVNTGDL